MARFGDKPFSGAAASKPMTGDVAMAAPSGRVESQTLPAPSQPNISSTGVPMGSRTSAAASASRIAGANASVHPTAAQAAGIHVVAPGETLSSIARLYGKARTDIARANSINAGAAVHVGQRLTIPGVKQAQIKTTPATPHEAAATSAPAGATAAKPAEKPTQVASVQPVATARLATPAAESPEPKASATAELTGAVPTFRWPVRGRVIAGYGAKVNGASNDGINLSVPEGTSVKAAEDGVVAYAGNELKGYGNLVLVRHSNGFVTAYAHASEIKVKRGDAVKRGQIVALAGQTGNVTSPQLHFEIRKGSTPIDPTQYLSN